MSIKSIADYTKDRLSRAFQYFPLGWLGKAKVERSPQSETVFKEKLKQVISSQGHHVRFLPYADRYTEETDEIRKAYPVMLRDPYIKQALYTKVFGVASLDLQIHSASKSARDKDIAEFAKHCIQKCRGGSRRAIMSIAIPGAIFGYSVTEINLRKPTSRGQFGQKITIESLKSKDVNKVQLEGDEFGNISGVRDKITNQFYHASNFLIYSHMPLFETPTGISDFRAAYRAYWLADTAWQLRAIGLERYGLPVIKGTYRSDPEQYALEQSLPNLRSQGWITVPEGALVEAMDIAARGTTDFESAIRDLREEMVLAIAGAILQMLTTTGTAEMRGSADVQKGTFELLQWYLAQEAADVLNDQLFPQLIDLNYRGADYPTCTFGGVNDGAMKDSITVDQFFLQSNLPLSKEEMYEKYGRQQPLSEDDAVTSPQAQQPQMPFGGGGGFGGGQFAEDGIDPQATVADQAKQIMGIQQVYAAGKIPRSAAIANAQLIKPDLAPDAAAALFPLRQAMPDGSAKFDESFAEKWITIGGKSGDDGKKKNGGKRVIIDDATGEIKGGAVPKAWQGKKVGDKATYAKSDTKPAKKSAKPAAKPAPTPDVPVTDADRDHVLKSLEGSPVHDISDLRKKLAKQLPGAKFDKAILDLADNRKIQVSQDSDPGRWTPEQRKQFVVEGDKVYTNVMVHPSAASNSSSGSLSPSKSIPWKGASVEDEHRWFGSKITVAPREGDAKRGELPQIGTLTRVLNKGDLVEFRPVGSAVAFRVPADRVSVDEIKDSGTKVKPIAQPVETPQQSPPTPSRPVLREIPAERVAKARAKVMQDPVAGVVLLGIGQSIKEAKDGKANSSDVFERARKQLAKLHPTEIDNVAKAFGIDTDKLFKHGNRANLVADAISQKFAPSNEKWSMSNPPATPFLPTSLISKVLKGSNTRFAALFKETGDFTDGRVMISAPSWRNLKVVRDYQPHEMEKNAGQIFASTMKKTRDEAFANRSSERAGVVARRMHAGEPHYGLSDGARSESVNGRYHELILKTHPGASVHLNKKEGGPISYVKDGVPVAVLMPMGSNHVKPPVSAPPPDQPVSARGRRNRPAQFDDEIDSGVAPSPASQSIYWPDIRQEHSWDCGPAEIVAAGRFCGIAMPPVDYVARECGSHETQDTAPGKLVRVMKAYGIDCQPKANMSFGTLRNHLAEGRPCVVHVTNWDGEDHYIAIIGNDGGMLEYHDPDGGYGQISEADFAQHWDGVDRFGVRYPRWGVAIIGRRGDGPDNAQQFDDGPRDSIIADAPHQDTDNAIRLSQASQQNGVEVVAKITEDAVTRLARLANPLQAASLFTMEERQALSEALASTLATADLLGRSRTHIRAEQVRRKAGGFKFSEPTSFQRFDDDPAPEAARVSALPPSRALEYFASLVPTITVAPTYAADVAGRAFTLAGVTETNILQRVKDVIQGRLETGQAFRAAPMDIQRVLDDAGVSTRNPQYSEMVFRTNMIQSYNRGSMDSMRDPDVAEIFPAWQYHGIRDGRQRLQHQAHFGRYFPKDVDFDSVRDHFYDGEFSGYNCRCTLSPVSKYEWKRLQERGESISELGSYPMPLS